ncbi:hypothetical protein B0H17DRAFT_42370 [Mycena rosella]|uniref:Uncharacterized protein n=1 Tax=Mycena rosella TaxID=1033263 RepID=A0AAD7D839_MYCRO|nr:hypothetical protein B0H17DRAFT_42370 [Mycena rosella]
MYLVLTLACAPPLSLSHTYLALALNPCSALAIYVPLSTIFLRTHHHLDRIHHDMHPHLRIHHHPPHIYYIAHPHLPACTCTPGLCRYLSVQEKNLHPASFRFIQSQRNISFHPSTRLHTFFLAYFIQDFWRLAPLAPPSGRPPDAGAKNRARHVNFICYVQPRMSHRDAHSARSGRHGPIDLFAEPNSPLRADSDASRQTEKERLTSCASRLMLLDLIFDLSLSLSVASPISTH